MLPELEQQACVGLAGLLPPKAACQPLRRAADLVTRRRQQMPIEELKAHLLSGHAHVYTQLIEAQLASQQPILALQSLLEAKGGIWADLATPTTTVPPNLDWIRAKQEWHRWREELLRWQQEERNSNSPSYQALCQAQRKTIEERLQAIEATITNLARRQHRLRPAASLPSVTEVQANLPADSTVLDYFVGSSDIWAVMMSSSATPQWVRLCRRRDVKKILKRLNLLLKSLQNKTPQQRRKVAQLQQPATDKLCRKLYNLLLAPLEPHLSASKRLILAPDDLLYTVPWSALLHGKAALGDAYRLTLLPSALVVGLPRPERSPSSPSGTPLALGYAGNPPLQHITAELNAIRRAVSDVRCVEPAPVSALTEAISPRWLHIAAHGHINRRSPLLSSLELADGQVLLADALNLTLAGTQLVTLSGCQTGTAPESGGVVLALSGAFLSAGARTVLSSLWSVDDQATQLLMSHLYAALQQDTELPAALQQAQQAVRTQGYHHPFYWAAFYPLSV